MKKSDWEHVHSTRKELVRISIEQTPLKDLGFKEEFLAAIYDRRANEIQIYRNDTKDYPLSINKDKYSVVDDIERTEDVSKIVVAGSTCDNKNLRNFLKNHILLIKCNPGKDHWLESIPDEIDAIMEST
jgi:hypothetical protein